MERSVGADPRLRPSLRPVTEKAIYRDAVTSEGVQPVTRSISQNQLRFKPTYGECSSPL